MLPKAPNSFELPFDTPLGAFKQLGNLTIRLLHQPEEREDPQLIVERHQ